MTFHSILFERPEDSLKEDSLKEETESSFVVDLNLNQIVDAITAGRGDYDLQPFFFSSLNSVDAIKYRHEIMQELENTNLSEAITSFAQKMRTMRENLAQADKLYYKYQKESWFLDAVEIYCDAVNCLVDDLTFLELKSRGFVAFLEYLTNYAKSSPFTLLQAETKKLKTDLGTVKYHLLINGDRITIRKDESEVDYSAEVEKTFEKFKQGAANDYRVKFPTSAQMNHIEAAVLDMVARLYGDIFLKLDNYYLRYGDYLDKTVVSFDREVQFYLAYLEYVARFKEAGLQFCYPRVSDTGKDVYCYEGFDLALATKLVREGSSIVSNDFYLKDEERILVVTGPNQGGKTTFARMFGQLHYLASLGCPVPGREAQLFLFDRLLTHFEKEENINNLRGKLEDDLVRIHSILEQSTPNSIIIINEMFSSTTLNDALFLGTKVLEEIMRLDLLCVYVTFIDELASLSAKTVSVVSTVVPENADLRTYKIVRRPADGRSYAIAIAKKYRLTYECIKERI